MSKSRHHCGCQRCGVKQACQTGAYLASISGASRSRLSLYNYCSQRCSQLTTCTSCCSLDFFCSFLLKLALLSILSMSCCERRNLQTNQLEPLFTEKEGELMSMLCLWLVAAAMLSCSAECYGNTYATQKATSLILKAD